MHFSHLARTLALTTGLAAVSVCAHADQVLQVGISVSAKDISVNGNTVLLSGDVRIAATPEQHLVLQAQKDGLQVKFSDNQNRTVIVSPFDTKSETVTFTPDGALLVDKRGNSVTIFSSGHLPEAANVAPAAPVQAPAAVTPAKPSAPVSVTIVQTPPPPDQPAPKRKKERYVDPVTDRGAVIP